MCAHRRFFLRWQHPSLSLSNVRYVKARRGRSVSNTGSPVANRGSPVRTTAGTRRRPLDFFATERRIHSCIHRAGTATLFRQAGMQKYDTSPVPRRPSPVHHDWSPPPPAERRWRWRPSNEHGEPAVRVRDSLPRLSRAPIGWKCDRPTMSGT